jgi:hypothetical protein
MKRFLITLLLALAALSGLGGQDVVSADTYDSIQAP